MPRTKKTAQPSYTASIKVLGKVYSSEGATPKEAIQALKVGSVAKGVSILTISKDGKEQVKILPSNQTSGLFSGSPMRREMALKQISMRFV